MSTNIDVVQEHDDIIYPQVVLFLLIHVGCVAAIWSGVTWQAIAICMVLYWSRMFAIGAGYHRYFSHRAYSTSRVFQFILAGTFETCSLILRMSADGGRPEVIGPRPKRR